MKWSDTEIRRKMEQRKDEYLRAIGEHAQNQMAELAHIIEGTLKNSVNFQIYNGYKSGVSSSYGKAAPNTAEVSKPEQDKVRVGSALVYAGPQEKHNGFASRAIDTIRRDGSVERIAKAVFSI